ncbi:hypothetical protein ASPBRDRAFT_198981 [Aspergillus brasiliensis CBS 101740]|uniref:Uncharacterized protein n=1 Tax=Aspergillus brasiliensis (strain CBS 101740 / IMI 381727 / IBT 21946) TaxID=767769 RepID=A0A1L9UAA3_ASPBC|nr:hypothetical protein ASPBRDRAFT_198981 [Aspergillus brasiliensis CBS 101740]
MNLAVIPMIPISLTAIIGVITIPILVIAAIPIALFVCALAICGFVALVVFGLFSMFVISPAILGLTAISWICVLAYRSCKLAVLAFFGALVDAAANLRPLPNGVAT